jgi:hypothetical protein
MWDVSSHWWKSWNLVKKRCCYSPVTTVLTSREEGGADPDFFDSNGPFRGYKRDLYEGGVRVPLIASWPLLPSELFPFAVNESQ